MFKKQPIFSFFSGFPKTFSTSWDRTCVQDTKNAMVTQHHAMVMASKEQGQPEFLTSRSREVDGAAQVTQEHQQQLVNGSWTWKVAGRNMVIYEKRRESIGKA